jgi:hypothetical protein
VEEQKESKRNKALAIVEEEDGRRWRLKGE